MRMVLALLLALITGAATVHVGLSVWHGLPLDTDLMALLPGEERDAGLQQAKTRMTHEVSQRIILLVGHDDGEQARAAAKVLHDGLIAAGVMRDAGDVPAAEALQRLGAVYMPHRASLLSDADRLVLESGEGQRLVRRAMSQIYGVGSVADSRLLAADPFLLLPAFLASLPVPSSRLTMQDGWLGTVEDGKHWILVSGRLADEAFALAAQEQFMASFGQLWDGLRSATPNLEILRLGAVFYAEAGARQAIDESSRIGTISLVGSVLLIVLVFRRAAPLLLSLLALGAGMVLAMSVSLLLFGQLHVASLMFGAALIGVAVDYSLHYFGQVFSRQSDPYQRLIHVLPGMVLGLITTLVGYAAMALSPLPGLRQIAMFSGAGLIGAFAAVALWVPWFDRAPLRRMPGPLHAFATAVQYLWDRQSLAPLRWLAILSVLALAGWGAMHLSVDDDVRRQQALDPVLAGEQARLQELIGIEGSGQFFLIRATTVEAALQLEEQLGQRLNQLVREGHLAGWRSPARFVPSLQRQQTDADLIRDRLAAPYLASFGATIGMAEPRLAIPSEDGLLLSDLIQTGALPMVATLISGEGSHIVALDNPRDLVRLAVAAEGLPGVRFVDPTADLTSLLGAYRSRALWLIVITAALMAPFLIWRYGLRGALFLMLPAAAALLLTPALLAVVGLPFTFFSAMGMVLLLSLGMDYGLFCAEAEGNHDPVTLLATWLTTLTTVLSFGLLAFSKVPAVQSFGAVLLVGVTLAAILAPLAGRARARREFIPWIGARILDKRVGQ